MGSECPPLVFVNTVTRLGICSTLDSEHDPAGLLTALLVVGKDPLCRGFNLSDIILMGLYLFVFT